MKLKTDAIACCGVLLAPRHPPRQVGDPGRCPIHAAPTTVVAVGVHTELDDPRIYHENDQSEWDWPWHHDLTPLGVVLTVAGLLALSVIFVAVQWPPFGAPLFAYLAWAVFVFTWPHPFTSNFRG